LRLPITVVTIGSSSPVRRSRGPPATSRLYPSAAELLLLLAQTLTNAIRTEVFDGPLELLLFLVRREGVDIREVSIAPITDAYLAQLELIHTLDLDVAGDFLVMAATLCQLKSRELLPHAKVDPELVGDEEIDPREALARRLLEYERYKEASLELAQREWLGRDTWAPNPPRVEKDTQAVDPGVEPLGLLEIFYKVLERHAEAPPVHEVALEPYSIKERAEWLLERLANGPRELADILRSFDRIRDRVLCFIAALEMARLQLIDVQQARHLGPVVMHARMELGDADLTALSEGA
jgi:segregation and condensation protein A